MRLELTDTNVKRTFLVCVSICIVVATVYVIMQVFDFMAGIAFSIRGWLSPQLPISGIGRVGC